MTAIPANYPRSTTQVARATSHRRPVLAILFSVLGSVAVWVAERAPRAAQRAGHAVLTIAGLGFLCAAAWTVDLTFGLVAIGLALLYLEWLVKR